MTLQTNEQVEAVPHNTTGLGGQDTHSGARTGQASSANRLCSRAQCTMDTEGAGGPSSCGGPSTRYWSHGAGCAVSGGHGPQEGVTLLLPRNGEAVELTGRLVGPL